MKHQTYPHCKKFELEVIFQKTGKLKNIKGCFYLLMCNFINFALIWNLIINFTKIKYFVLTIKEIQFSLE